MSDVPQFILDRDFKAPRDMVWRAWTEPDLIARWYGPNVETIIHKFDLKPGGVWLNEMKMGDKSDLSRMEFTDVTPKDKLVWLHSSTDKDWNVIANPMMPDWPKVLLTTVTFEDKGNGTFVRLVWTPQDATDAELACFKGAMDGFGSGWGAGFGIMDTMFEEMLG